MTEPHDFAQAGRFKKALAMVAVIDEAALKQRPKVSPFDQAGRILLASLEWTDAVWETIGVKAGYKPKPISETTRDLVRDVYRGRATAPVSRSRAS